MNLFSEIVDRFDYMKINKIPISDIAHEKGFEIIDTIGKMNTLEPYCFQME